MWFLIVLLPCYFNAIKPYKTIAMFFQCYHNVVATFLATNVNCYHFLIAQHYHIQATHFVLQNTIHHMHNQQSRTLN